MDLLLKKKISVLHTSLHVTAPSSVIPSRLFFRLTSWISFRQQVQVNLCSDRRKRSDNFSARDTVLTGVATIERSETWILKFCARGRSIDIKYCGEMRVSFASLRFPLRRGSVRPINGAGSLVHYVRSNIITITTTLLRSLYRAQRVLNSRGVLSLSSPIFASSTSACRLYIDCGPAFSRSLLSERPVLPSSRALSPGHLQTRQT